MRNKNHINLRKQSPYEILEANFVKWSRLNYESIQVLTPGYCSASCLELEEDLKYLGINSSKRRYNKITNETITTYKLKGSFK